MVRPRSLEIQTEKHFSDIHCCSLPFIPFFMFNFNLSLVFFNINSMLLNRLDQPLLPFVVQASIQCLMKNSILLHTLWSSSESRLGSFASGVTLPHWKNKDLLRKTLWILQVRSLTYKNLHICMTNKFVFPLLIVSLAACRGYRRQGLKSPSQKLGYLALSCWCGPRDTSCITNPRKGGPQWMLYQNQDFSLSVLHSTHKKGLQNEAFCSAILSQKYTHRYLSGGLYMMLFF